MVKAIEPRHTPRRRPQALTAVTYRAQASSRPTFAPATPGRRGIGPHGLADNRRIARLAFSQTNPNRNFATGLGTAAAIGTTTDETTRPAGHDPPSRRRDAPCPRSVSLRQRASHCACKVIVRAGSLPGATIRAPGAKSTSLGPVPRRAGHDGCPVGSRALRAPIRGPAGVVAARVGLA